MGKVEGRRRQRRSIAEKRRIVELAMQPGASIARIAREHGVNANMVHYWRKLYREGRLGQNKTDSVRLLPVSVSEAAPSSVVQPMTMSAVTAAAPVSTTGAIYIEFPKIHLRVEHGADPALLRVVLETLQR
ncbi:MAG: transposase [Candidatus Korobacteraceae bacterium]